MNKWRRLSAARRAALLEGFAAVAFVRLTLRLFPWRRWEGGDVRFPRARTSAGGAQPSVEDIAWAVRRVSRAVPGATCLTQALAARLLLSRRGYDSRLEIGVTRAAGSRLRAHAWLRTNDLVVIGGHDATGYTPLSATPRSGNQGAISLMEVQ